MRSNKILLCATVDYHFQAFHLPLMKWLKEQGWEVHVAAAGQQLLAYTDKKFDIPIHRSPLKKENVQAYKQLKDIIRKEEYTIIHSHTPMGGVLARLAGKRAKVDLKAIYTAHGFHFFKGAPLKNWLLYYPIERVLSLLTDTLITINSEDYERATNHRFSSKEITHVHGVGVDTDMFKPLEELAKKKQKEALGFNHDDLLLVYAAEFNRNKNQQLLIRMMARLSKRTSQVKLLLAGPGDMTPCEELAARLGVEQHISFMGLRDDIKDILPACDMAVGSSLREGLPVNIMEAMACGLPVIATKNRGHSELITSGENGWVIEEHDPELFADKVMLLTKNEKLRKKLGKTGRDTILSTYSLNIVLGELTQIYQKYMVEEGVSQWAVQ
ncbi:glycosyltransferase family 4 protein [Salipaludibacillus sp. LMS25]|uniref:glycosyltransferase family 4 protein n=1 Tax=Salipaludibacillus sp. LMS25 TaxID=2924031 RepID=UPI0020D02964|nr:glycosyltransferase family 4 protein [Salipaludibacillus sp. LMS25]UTR14884.1 glycosyltransferase family 4 protein [Salipaludibacillus sp. LMS25]